MSILSSTRLPVFGNVGLIVVIIALTILPMPTTAAVNAVRTIAGSGQLGIQDGDFERASFLMPVAIAFSKTGNLIIVDKAAQRIRELANGKVRTIAGSGQLDESGLHVIGGYRDGPAAKALFNEPNSVAIAADGSIFISDSGNHCIRRIKDGIVSTVLGSPDRLTHADGVSGEVGLAFPTAVAVDDAGILYIADFGFGVSRMLPDGWTEALPKEPNGRQRVVGLSAIGKGNSATLYATDLDGTFFIIRPGGSDVIGHNDGDIEGGGQRLLFGVAALPDNQFITTNLKTSSIAIYRTPILPFIGHWSGPVLAGGDIADPGESAGYADGPLRSARFYSPLGISVHNGEVAIADTGNRRIRLFNLPDVRRSLGPADFARPQAEVGMYRILYVGASYSYWGTSNDESIAGILESRLNKLSTNTSFSHHFEVSTFRIDDSYIKQEVDAIQNYVPFAAFNLILFGSEWTRLTYDSPVEWKKDCAEGGRAISKLAVDLNPRTKILVVPYPSVGSSSLVDDFALRDTLAGSSSVEMQREQSVDCLSSFKSSLEGKDLADYSAFQLFREHDDSAFPPEIWPVDEVHPTYIGREIIAEALFNVLVKRQPWSSFTRR